MAAADSEIMEIFIKKKTLHPTAQKREDVIKKRFVMAGKLKNRTRKSLCSSTKAALTLE
jgi:hypothetical protein